jgi:signal peptidase I
MELAIAVEHKAERKPWVAGVLSVLAPGCGHLYLGRPELGLCWFVSIVLFVIAGEFIARSPLLPPALNLAWVLIPFAGYVFLVRSAVSLARSVRYTYERTGWNRWYVYLGVLLAMMGISSFFSDQLRERVVQSYKIPSGAMTPTLLIGDHIYVDKLSYHTGSDPQRGDIIVFKFPEDETKDFVKRIVALPGDTIELRNKQVILNGVQVDDITYTQRIDPGVIDASINPRDNFGPVTVPDSSYFVLGDNRDQSLDSRFWGFVDASKIRGKVTVIYWSWSGKGKLSEWIRWRRIGQRVQ